MYYPCFCAQWRSKGRKWGQVPWDEGLEGRINTLLSHLKMRNLDQTMPKKCLFFEKKL